MGEQDEVLWLLELKEKNKILSDVGIPHSGFRQVGEKEPIVCKINYEDADKQAIEGVYLQVTNEVSKLTGIPVSYIRGVKA